MVDNRPSGASVCERQGGKIGRICSILVDDEGAADWAVVGGAQLDNESTLVPLTDAALEGETIVVPYEKEIIDGAPDLLDRHPQTEDVDAATEYYRQRIRHGPPAGG
jgi:hypothetical protein